MRVMMRLTFALIALVICLAPTGCGSSVEEGKPNPELPVPEVKPAKKGSKFPAPPRGGMQS